MKNEYLKALTAMMAPFFLSGCMSSGSRPASYSTIPLKSYQYTPAAISSGTEVSILGFSGGMDNSIFAVYYSQFICTEKKTGDTVRILAAWIAVPSEKEDAPTFTYASMFDGKKEVRDAAFIIPDDNQRMMLQAAGTGRLSDTAVSKNQYVILQDSVPLFKRSYRTTIGIMSFKQQVW